MDDAALAEAVRTRSVFGRVPPSLKARLVAALRESGEWVAMVGDGVNDILSLKQAQLGISMQSGSQATRAVADIVLLEDSFSALPEAVIEGQRIIAGMHDSLAVFLTRVLYMTLAILGAALLGLTMPVDPKLNTVVALLTVGIPALFLAFWAQPRRSSREALRQIMRLVTPPAVALVVLGLPLYLWADPSARPGRGPDPVHDLRGVLWPGPAAAAAPAGGPWPGRRRAGAPGHPADRPGGRDAWHLCGCSSSSSRCGTSSS